MRIVIGCLLGAVLSWSTAALADPFKSCTDAANYGYNVVRNLAGASYNRAHCDRDAATEYEQILLDLLPEFLADMGARSTAEGQACLLNGSYEGWLDTIDKEYNGCSGAYGFDAISRGLIGEIAGALFQEFYWKEPGYYTPDTVPTIFAYPYGTLDLKGTLAQCEAEIRGVVSGVSQSTVTALVQTVCH
ncbi:MAG: hypothetical protein QM784_38195 [Polyangiaceae bacterium]